MWLCSYYTHNGYERQILKQISKFILILVGFWPALSWSLWLWGIRYLHFYFTFKQFQVSQHSFLILQQPFSEVFSHAMQARRWLEFQKQMKGNIIHFLPKEGISSADLVLKKHSALNCLCLWNRKIVIYVTADNKILCNILILCLFMK